ncbi:unnamed protein product [Ixodes persulcatus]
MCPNHAENLLEEKLLSSVSLTERVKLWDRFSGTLSQEAVKLEFLRKARRTAPPFRCKRACPKALRAKVPAAVRELYRHPPPLPPAVGANPTTFEPCAPRNCSAPPTPQEQEEWLASVVALQASIARHLAHRQRLHQGHALNGDATLVSASYRDRRGAKAHANSPCNCTQLFFFVCCILDCIYCRDGVPSHVQGKEDAWPSKGDPALPGGCPPKGPPHGGTPRPHRTSPHSGERTSRRHVAAFSGGGGHVSVGVVTLASHRVIAENGNCETGFSYWPAHFFTLATRSQKEVVTFPSLNLPLTPSLSVPPEYRVRLRARSHIHRGSITLRQCRVSSRRRLCVFLVLRYTCEPPLMHAICFVLHPPTGKGSPKNGPLSPAMAGLSGSLQAYVDGVGEGDLGKLDERLVRILAWQRLQQLLPPPRRPNGLIRNSGPVTEVRARAVVCPVGGRGSPVPMSFRTLTMGSGADMDVCLSHFGHCNFVSSKHACIFYDEMSKHYELLNYSEHGTTVDNVLYSCDFSDKRSPLPPASAAVAALRGCLKGARGDHRMSATPQPQARRPCGCRSSGSSLIGGAGWEGTALLHHGSHLRLGCLQFVFSVTQEEPWP